MIKVIIVGLSTPLDRVRHEAILIHLKQSLIKFIRIG